MIRLKKAQVMVDTTRKIGLLIEQICGALCVFCFAVMTLVAILGVFFRYVMQSPFMWTEEAARYLLVWLGFSAISIALRQGRHIKVEVIANIAPLIVQKILVYVVDMLMGIFFAILLWQGYRMTVNNIMSASTIPISMSWILAAVPVGAGLALLQLFLGLVEKVLNEFTDQSDKQTIETKGNVI